MCSTRRIAWRVARGTRRATPCPRGHVHPPAAGELVDGSSRLGVAAGVTAGTFHALALAQLRRRAAEQSREPPRVLDRKARMLAPLPRRPRAARRRGRRRRGRDRVGQGPHARARGATPRPPGRSPAPAAARAEIAEIYERYELEKRKRRAFDFDDLLRRCADAIETDAEFAAGQRWRFRHLFVDEFQDATRSRSGLLRAWLGDRTDLCVVGDAAQAIYAFAGADAAPLTRVQDAVPRRRPSSRSTRTTGRRRRSSQWRRPRSVRPPVSTRPEWCGRCASTGPRRPITEHGDDGSEAAAVAEACWEEFAGGVPWSEMAVLFRTNAQSALFETAFCAAASQSG